MKIAFVHVCFSHVSWISVNPSTYHSAAFGAEFGSAPLKYLREVVFILLCTPTLSDFSVCPVTLLTKGS